MNKSFEIWGWGRFSNDFALCLGGFTHFPFPMKKFASLLERTVCFALVLVVSRGWGPAQVWSGFQIGGTRVR